VVVYYHHLLQLTVRSRVSHNSAHCWHIVDVQLTRCLRKLMCSPRTRFCARRARRRSGGRGRRWGPELRAAAAMGREETEQWREDLEAARAAGRPGCAGRAAREDDDEVRRGRSFRRRQQLGARTGAVARGPGGRGRRAARLRGRGRARGQRRARRPELRAAAAGARGREGGG
jgi:hypothetical protein